MSSVVCKEILVVDDSESIRECLNTTLERAGFVVRVCSDGAQACKEIAANPPDIVISDWQMPNMDGGELCKWVRNRDEPGYIYFILVSAHERFFNAGASEQIGADDFLEKPIKANQLLARIRCGQRILSLERNRRSTLSDDLISG